MKFALLFALSAVLLQSSSASWIHNLPHDITKGFHDVTHHVTHAASDATHEITEHLDDVAGPCAGSIWVNKGLFYTIAGFQENPAQIIAQWNPMRQEILSMAEACNVNPHAYEWLENSNFQLTPAEVDDALCIAGIIGIIEDCVDIANVEDDPVAAVTALIHLVSDSEEAYTGCSAVAANNGVNLN